MSRVVAVADGMAASTRPTPAVTASGAAPSPRRGFGELFADRRDFLDRPQLRCCDRPGRDHDHTNKTPRRIHPQTWPYVYPQLLPHMAARNANTGQAVAPFNPRPLLQSLYVANTPTRRAPTAPARASANPFSAGSTKTSLCA
jgi:hypothetical protein